MLYPLSYGGPGERQTVPAQSPPASPATCLRWSDEQGPARVLVVDDTANVRALIRVNLEIEGFEVNQAADGQEALDAARRRARRDHHGRHDAAAGRPDSGGRLKASPATAAIPIVMVTARAQAVGPRAGARPASTPT